jgi:hypothetical protein
MAAYLQIQKIKFLLVLGILVTTFSYAQRDSEVWKLQLAVGINNPMETGENVGFYSKYVNFPTVNMGLQHMFSESLGAKLDFGYNRSSNHDSSLEFKLNYTRVNAQIVYNLRSVLSFLPERIAVVAHAGPGISFTQPLGDFSDNKYTFLNALGGMELHYGLSKSLSIYTDLGYVYSLAGKNKYDANVDGFSFNDDLIYATFGISILLNGCNYCN